MKTVLVPFEGSSADIKALESALSLAEEDSAHVEAWNVFQNPETIFIPYSAQGMSVYAQEALLEMRRSIETRKEAARKKFSATLEKVKTRRASASFHAIQGRPEILIPQRARVCDLIITARPSKKSGDFNLVNSLLFESGRPVLFLPPKARLIKNGKTALIAWNGEKEAAHAIDGAISFFGKRKFFIFSAIDGSQKAFSPPESDLARYLERRGIEAEILKPQKKGGKDQPARLILEQAKSQKADIVVMGAYSHSRIREIVLGGVTRHMLHHADLPLLMAH